jgi:hypothetical protein
MNFKEMNFVMPRPDVHSIKVKLSLCITKHHAMKNYPMCFIKHHNMKTYGSCVYIRVFVTCVLHGGEWLRPTPSASTAINGLRYPGDEKLGGSERRYRKSYE